MESISLAKEPKEVKMDSISEELSSDEDRKESKSDVQ